MTTIIFDWDDTISPSTYLSNKTDLDNVTKYELQLLEDIVVSLLLIAIRHGTVYIVTNASTEWVISSGSKYLPRVINLIQESIPIISARDRYEKSLPPIQWKPTTFRDIIKQTSPKSIISIGDSQDERLAMIRLKGQTQTKIIKLIDKPTINQIRYELRVIIKNFCWLHNQISDLDFSLVPSPPEIKYST